MKTYSNTIKEFLSATKQRDKELEKDYQDAEADAVRKAEIEEWDKIS